MQTRIFILFLIGIMAVSCGSSKKSKTDNNTKQKMMDDPAITGMTWKLATLDGKKIAADPNQKQDIQFTLQKDGKITGFTGCNTFNGTYTIEEGNRISFSQMVSTRRACFDVKVNEFDFLQVFQLTDNYTVKGNSLMLNVGKRAPLAAFAK